MMTEHGRFCETCGGTDGAHYTSCSDINVFHPYTIMVADWDKASGEDHSGVVIIDDLCGPDLTDEQKDKLIDWYSRANLDRIIGRTANILKTGEHGPPRHPFGSAWWPKGVALYGSPHPDNRPVNPLDSEAADSHPQVEKHTWAKGMIQSIRDAFHRTL